MMVRRLHAAYVVAALTSPLISSAALAQAPKVASDSSGVTLGDIIVTAQRREQTAQSVAASIAVLSGAQLTDSHIREPADIARLTPGLSTLNRTADTLPTFSIRGIGLDDFNPNNTSATAVYIDGVFQTGSVFLAVPIFDVARVEVLKGPQGTLYGQNATGGAISFLSNQPTDDLDGYVTAGYGRYDTIDLNGAVGGSLGHGFSARVAGTFTHQGHGFQTDIDTGREIGAKRRFAGRGLLKYESGIFSTVLNIHGGHDYSIPASYQHDGSGPDADLFDSTPLSAKRVRVGDLPMRRRETSFGTSLTTTVDLGTAELISILGYDHIKRFVVDNNDGNPQPVYDFTQNEKVGQFYEETRLSSKEPLFGRTNWILGTNYSRQHFLGNDFTDQSTFFVGVALMPPDIYTRGLSVASAHYLQKPSSLGFFANTSTDIVHGLRLILGARYSRDRVHAQGATLETGTADGGVLFNGVGSVVDSVDETRKSSKFDYRAGLEYDVAKDILFYGTVSTGSKSGLYYLGPAVTPVNWRYVKPERLTSYEAGLKTSFLDRKATLNVAGFYYDYRDRQTGVLFITFPLFAASLANIPKASVKGFEVEANVRPLPGLALGGSLTYLDGKIKKSIDNVDGAPLLEPAPPGTRLAQAPKWTYNLNASYRVDLSDELKVTPSLNFQHVSTQTSAAFDALGNYGPQNVLDGRIAVSYRNDWTVALWGRNLTNNDDLLTANSGLIGRTVFIRPPISYGVELTKKF